jgi:hypothetical protein
MLLFSVYEYWAWLHSLAGAVALRSGADDLLILAMGAGSSSARNPGESTRRCLTNNSVRVKSVDDDDNEI